MPQDRPGCLVCPPLEAPQGLPSDNKKSGGLQRKVTGNGSGGNHRRDGGHSVATTVGVNVDRRGGVHQPATLAAEVWGGMYRTTEYCWGVWRLDGQQSPNLGGLQGTDVGAPHQPRQVPWGKASRYGGDLAEDAGKVCVGGDRGGGQEGLRDESYMRWPGGRDLRGDPCSADSVETTLPGGGLGVPPH